jgi:hypothetical protein
MVVLMAFNKKDQWTFEELVAETGKNNDIINANSTINHTNVIFNINRLQQTLENQRFIKFIILIAFKIFLTTETISLTRIELVLKYLESKVIFKIFQRKNATDVCFQWCTGK